jgi:hypothetical protein
MDHNTPAKDIKPKDLAANTKALAELLDFVEGPIKQIVDIRYGLGGWAQEYTSQWPRARVVAYEQDEETAAKAWTNDQVNLEVGPFKPQEFPFYHVDLLLADFNTLTVLKDTLLVEALAVIEPKWVIFTDVCCSKLHLNYRSYGLKKSDGLDAYWCKFAVEGYGLVRWRKFHHAASSALYQRQK